MGKSHASQYANFGSLPDANDAGLTTEERKEKRIHESYPLILEFESELSFCFTISNSL